MLPLSLRIAGLRLSLDPRDQAFVQDPYAAYDAMRAAGPAVLWEQYGHWCFTSHEAVSALLKDRRFGRQILHVAPRQSPGWAEPEPHLAPFHRVERHSLLELEPPDHTRLRALVNRAFVSRQVERLKPRIEALAHRLIDAFPARGTVDLLEAFATPIPVVIIAELLGVPPERAPHLLEWSHAMVAMYQFRRSRQVEDEAVAATEAFVAFLRGCIDDKRRRPADDLISTLIAAAEAGDRMSEDELVSTCILVLNAGHEATVHAIGNGVKAMLEHDVRIGDAPLDGLVEETLRHDAPLHMFTRFALEDCKAFGVAFKKGDVAGLLLGAANRDPARFADPHRFDAARTGNAHVSFGAGIHFCVGAALARLELATALPILFERLPGLRLASAPAYRDTYHFHGLERLDVSW